MPRTRSLAWSELKVGLVTVFALVMATGLVFTLSGEGGFFWQRYSVKTIFADIPGLKEGAPVRVAGLEVGSVVSMAFLGDRVEVVMEISRAVQPRITDSSKAVLGSVSLLGEAAVDISSSMTGTPIPEWGYVPSGRAAGSVAEVATQATSTLQEASKLVADIRAGRGTIGKLATDEALYTELTRVLTAAEDVTRRISAGRGTVGRLLNDPAAAKALEASLQNLEGVTAGIRAGKGSIGKLLTDDALATSLTATTANLDTITGRISRGEGTLGQLMTNKELFDRLNAMTQRLDTVVAALQQGDGTAGQLLKDRRLYENMNRTATELEGLVKDIRADPKKYLNVRVSLF